jgi:hypothetical protein
VLNPLSSIGQGSKLVYGLWRFRTEALPFTLTHQVATPNLFYIEVYPLGQCPQTLVYEDSVSKSVNLEITWRSSLRFPRIAECRPNAKTLAVLTFGSIRRRVFDLVGLLSTFQLKICQDLYLKSKIK